jgi:hypothetical protein
LTTKNTKILLTVLEAPTSARRSWLLKQGDRGTTALALARSCCRVHRRGRLEKYMLHGLEIFYLLMYFCAKGWTQTLQRNYTHGSQPH